MSSMMVLIPPNIGDYDPNQPQEFKEIIERIIHGDIGENIIKQLLEQFDNSIDEFFDDLETSRIKALKNYSSLQLILREISKSEEILPKIRHLYGDVISSNFRFSFSIIVSLIQTLITTVQQSRDKPPKISSDEITELKKRMREIIKGSGGELPDATEIDVSCSFDKILIEMIMAFNIASLISLVIIVAALTRNNYKLDSNQIESLEILMRDWSQEVIAQLAMIGDENNKHLKLIELEGIVPDQEDFDLSN